MHRLDRSVEYVMDKDKTSRMGAGSAASSLEEAVDDARGREKTECGVFESAIGCTLDTAYLDMRANKERWGRMDGVQGYHLVQSFAGGELTPELAHRIGLELAERLLHGQYSAVVATHLNISYGIRWRWTQAGNTAAAPEPTIPGCALSRTGCAGNMGCR